MAERRNNDLNVPAHDPREKLRYLAHEALRTLANEDVIHSHHLQKRIQMLSGAFLSGQEKPRSRAIQRLRADGVTPNELIDELLPNVARHLGQRWADDTLSFAEVTIGTARLQETVRDLSRREMAWTRRSLDDVSTGQDVSQTPRVLMVIPRPEEHTMGVFVAADQFRRFGYDVDIAVDQRPTDIVAALKTRNYCMVGITISGRRALASTIDLVEIVRKSVTRVTPLVLGGSLVSSDHDLKRDTGVDHVALTVKDALEMCGLDIVEADPPHLSVTSHAI